MKNKQKHLPISLWVVAGEASGDNHGGALLHGLRKLLPELTIAGVGGSQMQAAGLVPWLPFSSLRGSGLIELLVHIPRLMIILWQMEVELKKRKPTGVLLIDYSGFNLRLAERAKRLGIPVWYYSGPQIWAWRPARIEQVKRAVQMMLVVFPFEEQLYLDAGVSAHFLGHPLVGQVPTLLEQASLKKQLKGWQGDVIALMPGSRSNEIKQHLPPLLDAARLLLRDGRKARFVLPLADNLNADNLKQDQLKKMIKASIAKRGLTADVLVAEKCYLAVLKRAKLAAVGIGTATLQAALANLPLVVICKANPITFWLAKRLALQSHLSIVNILAGRTIVPELLQNQCTAENIYQHLKQLYSLPQRKKMLAAIKTIIPQLGEAGAYQRAAQLLAKELKVQALKNSNNAPTLKRS